MDSELAQNEDHWSPKWLWRGLGCEVNWEWSFPFRNLPPYFDIGLSETLSLTKIWWLAHPTPPRLSWLQLHGAPDCITCCPQMLIGLKISEIKGYCSDSGFVHIKCSAQLLRINLIEIFVFYIYQHSNQLLRISIEDEDDAKWMQSLEETSSGTTVRKSQIFFSW